MKRAVSVILSAAIAATALLAGACSDGADVNATVPSGYTELSILQESNGNTVYGVGTELEPHFHYANVGRKGQNADGTEWECKAEDWENIFLPRMREMNLKRLRFMMPYSWFAPEEASYTGNAYTWESEQMLSLYKVLDAAQEMGMDVNLTLGGGGWGPDVSDPTYKTVYSECFAALIGYLYREKGYTCVTEITPFNEPNSTYVPAFGPVRGFNLYAELCRELDRVFKEKGLRDKVKFNLSDDARGVTWLEQTLENLQGVYDVVNSHTYDFKIEDSNDFMINGTYYPLGAYTKVAKEYGAVHMFGEFGTGYDVGTHSATDRLEPSRGLLIARIALNMLCAGSSGFSYWPLFCQYYGASLSEQLMDMGLWGFADEGYACRPVYYAYTLFTRFCLKGMQIFPVETGDENLVAVALKSAEGKWSYFIVNDSAETSKQVAFLNRNAVPASFRKYVYDQNNVPTDNKPIAPGATLAADGRVLADTVAPLTVTVYTDLS